MPQLPKEKLFGIYRGVVESNADPTESGRCQIRIFGLHTDNKKVNLLDSVPTENLIWAMPCIPIFGGISQVGIYGVPCQGAHVFVFFENGNIMQPRYFATAPGIPKIPPTPEWGFSDPDGVYPKEFGGKPDWNRGSTLDAYGDLFVIEDKGGNKIVLDSKVGSEQIYFQTGGSVNPRLTLFSDGRITKQSGGTASDESFANNARNTIAIDSINTIGGRYSLTTGGTEINTLGNHTESISGPSDVSVTGIENKTSGGLSQNIKGDSNISVGGKADYISDDVTIIKSNTASVKLKATMMNVEMMALIGQVKSQSMLIDMQATMTALFKGLISTTVGGGITTLVDGTMTTVKGQLTTINGSGMVTITGGMIMIG